MSTTLNTSVTPNSWTRIYYVRAIAYDREGTASAPLYIDFTKQ